MKNYRTSDQMQAVVTKGYVVIDIICEKYKHETSIPPSVFGLLNACEVGAVAFDTFLAGSVIGRSHWTTNHILIHTAAP